MKNICKKCNIEFEHHRKRRNCFNCYSGKKIFKSDDERLIEVRKRRVEYVNKRRHKIKKMALEYKGNKCSICGYDRCKDALDFHHLNPEEKNFSIGNEGYAKAWKTIKKELDKCILVCANCHREIHADNGE